MMLPLFGLGAVRVKRKERLFKVAA